MSVRLLILSGLCFVIGAVVRWDTADYKRFLAAFLDACAMAGITSKERAFAMQLDKGQLSRIESGLLPLHMHRVVMLGASFPAFFQNFAVMLVRDYGLSPEAHAAALLANATSAGSMRRAS